MIFIDTGAFLGRLIERDQHHSAAIAFWSELSQSAVPCFTSNLVLTETLTLLARRTSYRFAATQALYLYGSRVLHILRPTHAEEMDAISWFDKFADQGVSFTDCVSFVSCAAKGSRKLLVSTGTLPTQALS